MRVIPKRRFLALPEAVRSTLLEQQPLRRRAVVVISQNGSAQTGAAGYMPFPGKITAVGFTNDSGNNFTGAANVAVTGGTVASSTVTLANQTSERITSVANNLTLAEGAAITLTTGTTAGTGPTHARVEVQENVRLI